MISFGWSVFEKVSLVAWLPNLILVVNFGHSLVVIWFARSFVAVVASGGVVSFGWLVLTIVTTWGCNVACGLGFSCCLTFGSAA